MAPKKGKNCDESLADLLTEDIFVDFFNTFLNLPVFGQTPLFCPSENRWYMCPEIPQKKKPRSGSFYQWMRSCRLAYFKRTELYSQYILCKELLLFTAAQSKEEQRWTAADRWLLRRCLGSVRGMRRFCSFVKGTRGEELLTFCVRVEKLLQMDCQQDPSQMNRYQAMFTIIKAAHLSEGSTVLATCRSNYKGLPEMSPGGRRDPREQVLAQMRSRALHCLRSYWLLKYLHLCQAAVTTLKGCAAIAEQYRSVTYHFDVAGKRCLTDPVRWLLGPEQPEGPLVVCSYSSKEQKRVLWQSHQRPGTSRRVGAAGRLDGPDLWQWLPLAGERGLGECTNMVHQMSRRGEEINVDEFDTKRGARRKKSARFRWVAPLMKINSAIVDRSAGVPTFSSLPFSKSLPSFAKGDEVIPPHGCMQTPVCHFPPIASQLPHPRPSTSKWGHGGDEHLSLALSADALAGGPYEDFLRARGYSAMLWPLGLWQHLDGFLNLLLNMEEGSSQALRQVLAKKIVDVYLDDTVMAGGRSCSIGLSKPTSMQLVSLLPSGDVLPWIHIAKHELCQILAPTFEEFLDQDDKQLLLYLFSQTELRGKVSRGTTLSSSGPSAPQQQVRRMKAALALCQACCGHHDPEPLTEEAWAMLPLEDLGRGGSLHLHYGKINMYDLPFEILAQRYPKAAVEEISKTHKLYCAYQKPEPKKVIQIMETESATHEKASKKEIVRPRIFSDIMRSPSSIEQFRGFLRPFDAHKPLKFCQDVEKLRGIDNPANQKAKINSIVARYLKRADAEESLQCTSKLITQIAKMKVVTPDTLYAVQELVLKAMETAWFRKYQETFPSCEVMDPNMHTARLRTKLKPVWGVLFRFIKSICKFRSSMRDSVIRSKFESYLRNHGNDFSLVHTPTQGNKFDLMEPVGLCAEDGDMSHLKRRVVNNRLVTLDFLVSDLSFFLETESFRNMADSSKIMASAGMYGENDYALLHQKADMIINLFLASEISPTLRINISETTKEVIQHCFTSGKLHRGLFYEAMMTVFPNLLYCWKKFCNQKVKKNFEGIKDVKKVGIVLPDYIRPFDSKSDWYWNLQTSTSPSEEFPTLRFTVHHGLHLIFPQNRLDIKVSTSIQNHHKAAVGRRRSMSMSASDSKESLVRNSTSGFSNAIQEEV